MIQKICLCSLAIPLLWSPIAAALAEEKAKPTFGQRQVEQLLDDRPEMRPVLQPDDAVFTWAVKQFEGGGERIYWDHREPAAGQASEFIPSSGNDPRRIRIARRNGDTGAQKWARLVFELNYSKSGPRVAAIVRSATSGELSKQEFANALLKLEFEAMIESKDFLRKNPIPGFAPPELPAALADFVKLLDLEALDEKYDRRNYYASYYDRLVRPLVPPPSVGAEWGDLEITFTAETAFVPKLLNTEEARDTYCRGVGVVDETFLVDPGSLGVANILIWLNDETPKVHPDYGNTGKDPVVLSTTVCRFEPHIATVLVGQELRLTNRDFAVHQPEISAFANPPFNPLIARGRVSNYTFRKPEHLPLQVRCNIHEWMRAYVLAKSHPYMGVSQRDGKLTIANLPAGRQSFKAWREPKYLQKVIIDGASTRWRRGIFEVDIPSGGLAKLRVVVPLPSK